MDNNQRVIDFCLNTQWDDFPDTVQHQSKKALLDNLGVLIAGGLSPVSRITNEFVEEQMDASNSNAACTVVHTGKKVSTLGAVLANGIAANALDMDDGDKPSKGHPGACLLPVLLAAAELNPDTCARGFLTAMVIGYEVAIRAASIRHATYQTYHSSGSWGAIGGVAAGARIMGIDKETLYRGLGVAEYHAPIAPMMKGIDVASMAKDSIGWGAMVAMSSILLAKKGFTGVAPLFNDVPESSKIMDLGERWRILELYFKPYACCHWAQAPITGTLRLMALHGLTPNDIEKITVRSFYNAVKLPSDPPQNTEQAQYNIAYPIATAVLKNKLGPMEVTPPAIFDRDAVAFMKKIEPVHAPEFDKTYPDQRLAQIIIQTKDNRLLDSGPLEALWAWPDSLPTDKELTDKFIEVVSLVLGRSRALELSSFIWELSSKTNAARIIEMITPDKM